MHRSRGLISQGPAVYTLLPSKQRVFDRPALHPAEEVKPTLTLREQLLGVWHWPRYRLFGRCWAEGCGRLMTLHTPWALYICERTPMGIVITDKGRDLIAMEAGANLPAA
jgi:hypothetical protein